MRTQREGFTLIEMMLVTVLGLLIVSAAYGTLVRQEQTYGAFRAMTGTQQDTRIGVDLLRGELRELSASGGDLLMATADSLRFRALRKYGLLCGSNKTNKKLSVAQLGADPFSSGDSLLVYVDRDTLKAEDDIWQPEYVNVASASTCGSLLGTNLLGLMPGAAVMELTVGNTLKFDSVFVGAPIRSFEVVTYRPGTWDGKRMLMRSQAGGTAPILGPIPTSGGFELTYYDTLGTELTSFPLDAAERASVDRIRVLILAERGASAAVGQYRDSLITDIHLRGN